MDTNHRRVPQASSSATSTSDGHGRRRVVVCDCGVVTPLRTSWTDENPGRRFYGCGLYQGRNRRCGFFQWHDREFNQREKKVIAWLLTLVEGLKKKEKFWFGCTGICCVVIVVLLMVIGLMYRKL
ncbi:uncharacterized protein LOC130732164 [Lotus japonicus]|uniref:uncharacterized protein LOC130732164 n=1 Tax=Lotus japonicus TaxID=34305 RepID=UPI00258AC24B|nr:uncharacterized protein LOC130732164 [Lotus japonicus]